MPSYFDHFGATFGDPRPEEITAARTRTAGATPFRAAPEPRPSPPPAVAPTLAGVGGAGFRQPVPTGEVIPQSEGVIGGNVATGAPEVIRGTTRGTGDVHPSWQLYHNAGRGEDYPGAVAAFRRSEGLGALKAQEGAADRAAKIEEARITGEAHVKAADKAGKSPYYEGMGKVAEEQALELKRKREAAEAKERGVQHDNWYKNTHGGTPPKEGEPTYADYQDSRNWEMKHPGEGPQRYEENQALRKIEPLWTPENLAAHGITIPPEVQQNQDLLRKTMLRFGPRLQRLNQETLGGATSPDQFLTGQTPGFVPGP